MTLYYAALLYFSPVGLLAFFELFAFGRRRGWRWLQVLVAVTGIASDVACNYTWFRLLGAYPWKGLGWRQRTVTARVTEQAQLALDATRARTIPSAAQCFALALAMYLNSRDPDHCKLT